MIIFIKECANDNKNNMNQSKGWMELERPFSLPPRSLPIAQSRRGGKMINKEEKSPPKLYTSVVKLNSVDMAIPPYQSHRSIYLSSRPSRPSI